MDLPALFRWQNFVETPPFFLMRAEYTSSLETKIEHPSSFLLEQAAFSKGNPNVDLAVLKANYVDSSDILYIGKATSLKKRLGQLLRFGAGSAVGHWGGRFLWQLADSENLLIAWKLTPTTDPKVVESTMLNEFISLHGKLPFANLTI